MPVPRTELRDEIAVLIAAGRELSPDHDRVLADVFIDRIAGTIESSPRATRHLPAWRHVRRWVGTAVLAAACLGSGMALDMALSNHGGGASQTDQAQLPSKMQAEIPSKAQAVAGKGVPPVSKVPSNPQFPSPKMTPGG